MLECIVKADGTLEIQASNSFGGKGGPPGGSAVYELPLSLASGATKHLRTFLSEDYPGTVDARIIAQGRVLASQQTNITNTVSGLLVGVVSDQPSALDAIATVHPGGVAPSVIHLAAADVPESSLPRLSPGMPVAVTVAGAEGTIAGSIRRISPEIDRASRFGSNGNS